MVGAAGPVPSPLSEKWVGIGGLCTDPEPHTPYDYPPSSTTVSSSLSGGGVH